MLLRFAVGISIYLTQICTITSPLLYKRCAKDGAIILGIFCYEGNFLSDSLFQEIDHSQVFYFYTVIVFANILILFLFLWCGSGKMDRLLSLLLL